MDGKEEEEGNRPLPAISERRRGRIRLTSSPTGKNREVHLHTR